MDHPHGAGLLQADRVDFAPACATEFRGTELGSHGGLLAMRELNDVPGRSDLPFAALSHTPPSMNTFHRLDGLFRKSVYGRLAELAVTGPGARNTRRDPPIVGVTAMRTTAIRARTRRERKDRSVRYSEKGRRRAGTLWVHWPIRPTSGVWATAGAAWGEKRRCSGQSQMT